LGAAIYETAQEWNIEIHDLADAIETVWAAERDAISDIIEARKAARQKTGLTLRKIYAWEDAGHDYASYPSLDITARTLAREFPMLGIGPGYSSEVGYEHIDYAARLWEILRKEDPKLKPRHDLDILRQAAEMVSSGSKAQHYGPLTFSTQRFAEYLSANGIPWPRLDSGALSLDDDTFKEMGHR
jgi:hypothetical protein